MYSRFSPFFSPQARKEKGEGKRDFLFMKWSLPKDSLPYIALAKTVSWNHLYLQKHLCKQVFIAEHVVLLTKQTSLIKKEKLVTG